MMYPGDLNGGAENVANCRCWLSYTNEKPNNLKEYTSVSVGSTYKPSIDRPFGGLNITSKTKPVSRAVQSVVSTGKKLTTKIKSSVRKITKPIKNTIKKIPNKTTRKLKNTSEGLDAFFTEEDNNRGFKQVDSNKPNKQEEIEYFKEQLKDKIPNEYIDNTSNIISGFRQLTHGLNHERAIFFNRNNKLIGKHKSADKKAHISFKDKIGKKIKEYGEKHGLSIGLHNHPWGKSSIPSLGDVASAANMKQYIGVGTSNNGTTLIVNRNPDKAYSHLGDIESVYKDWFKKLNETIEKECKTEIDKLKEKYPKHTDTGKRDKKYNDEYKDIQNDFVIDNSEELAKELNEILSPFGVNIYYLP